MKALNSSYVGGGQSNTERTSPPQYPFYNRTAEGMDYDGWCARGKPMLVPKLYFTNRCIGNVVYSPVLNDGIFVQNVSNIPVKWAVWRLLAINDEQFPIAEQYPLYAFQRKPYLEGELEGGDCCTATYINEHIRVFADVDGTSQNSVQSNQQVKATNQSNSIDLEGGRGYIRLSKLASQTQSVSTAMQATIIDYNIDPNSIIIEKNGSLDDTAVSMAFTQAGLQLPLKISRLGVSDRYMVLKFQDQYLFTLYRADDPNKEIICSNFYIFDPTQLVVITSSPNVSAGVAVNIVSKTGCEPYYV